MIIFLLNFTKFWSLRIRTNQNIKNKQLWNSGTVLKLSFRVIIFQWPFTTTSNSRMDKKILAKMCNMFGKVRSNVVEQVILMLKCKRAPGKKSLFFLYIFSGRNTRASSKAYCHISLSFFFLSFGGNSSSKRGIYLKVGVFFDNLGPIFFIIIS